MPQPDVSTAARYAIAVMGPDRPGIVAAVSAALLELGCNLEDVATSILSGYFSMMLVVSGPAGTDVGVVREALARLETGGLATATWPIHGAPAAVSATHVLTAYGPDATGIVRALSADLSVEGIDICDMVCRRNDGDAPIYVVTMEIHVPAMVDPGALGQRIGATCGRLGLDSTFSEIERVEL